MSFQLFYIRLSAEDRWLLNRGGRTQTDLKKEPGGKKYILMWSGYNRDWKKYYLPVFPSLSTFQTGHRLAQP